MNIGACKVRLRLPENHSLKGKRHTVKSITSRVAQKFNVSVAEVDDQDLWQLATIGITCVSNHGRHANEILSQVVNFIQNISRDAEFLGYEIELVDAL